MNPSSTCLPENLRRAMNPSDRFLMGKKARTMPEIEKAIDAKSEKQLQGLISQYLRQKGIEFICPPMNKRSALPIGWPDFTFSYRGTPFLFECKVGANKQSEEQCEMEYKLRQDGWRYFVITELEQVRTILRAVEERCE